MLLLKMKQLWTVWPSYQKQIHYEIYTWNVSFQTLDKKQDRIVMNKRKDSFHQLWTGQFLGSGEYGKGSKNLNKSRRLDELKRHEETPRCVGTFTEGYRCRRSCTVLKSFYLCSCGNYIRENPPDRSCRNNFWSTQHCEYFIFPPDSKISQYVRFWTRSSEMYQFSSRLVID